MIVGCRYDSETGLYSPIFGGNDTNKGGYFYNIEETIKIFLNDYCNAPVKVQNASNLMTWVGGKYVPVDDVTLRGTSFISLNTGIKALSDIFGGILGSEGLADLDKTGYISQLHYRFKFMLKQHDGAAVDTVAKFLGTSVSYLVQVLAGTATEVPSQWIKLLATEWGYSEDWILTGKGSMLHNKNKDTSSKDTKRQIFVCPCGFFRDGSEREETGILLDYGNELSKLVIAFNGDVMDASMVSYRKRLTDGALVVMD